MNFIGADSSFESAGAVLFGAPYDSTTSFRPGARFGSQAMRAESFGIETYSPYQDRDLGDVRVHDAGDLDLRIESQAGESYILAMAYEQFHPEIDVTAIDQQRHVTEIHEADGKNDILQQIENGALSVVSAYNAFGRNYRGIIASQLRQYVLLGDAAAMTDGIPGNEDDRWIYTENNPGRDMGTAYMLAGTARALRGFNDPLAARCLEIARTMFQKEMPEGPRSAAPKLRSLK